MADAQFSPGVELIHFERLRQIQREGWTPEHDDEHTRGQLQTAARCYLDIRRPPMNWPWDPAYWKPTPDDRIRELVKAGALIAAEIDRLTRLEARRG